MTRVKKTAGVCARCAVPGKTRRVRVGRLWFRFCAMCAPAKQAPRPAGAGVLVSRRGAVAVNHAALRYVFSVPRRLESPNIWNGRHWRVKHRISQDWEKAIGSALCDALMRTRGRLDFATVMTAQGGPKFSGLVPDVKMRVIVERQVPSARNFIRDDDNLKFAIKPLLDALKRQGYIRNDSRPWLESPLPTQAVSADGADWTVITIEPAVPR